MAYTKYTGKDMTVSWKSITLAGVREVSIDEADGPLPEDKDYTDADSSAYEITSDPLGSKGADKLTVTIKGLGSTVNYADAGVFKEAMGATGALAFESDGTDTGKDKYDHATMYLQKRTLRVKHDAYTEYEIVLEANSLGTWGSTA